MEVRKCSNTTLLIEAIALMNDAQERQERLEKVQSGWGMTFLEKLYLQTAIAGLLEANRKIVRINELLTTKGERGTEQE